MSFGDFEQKWSATAKQIDAYLAEALDQITHQRTQQMTASPAIRRAGLKTLAESMSYSICAGGKRFRPVLCLWCVEVLGGSVERALPFAAAIEMIHGYSLIHDDLPCMDDDDFRREKPSNHKVFGEATALLAGNTLLTEAVGWVAKSYEPAVATPLMVALCSAAGFDGMVGGQALDILADRGFEARDLDELHALKTGAMIRVAAQGAAILASASASEAATLVRFARRLGLAFQVADDILDYDPKNVEPISYPAIVGIDETKRYLRELTVDALADLEGLGQKAWALSALARYNGSRDK